MFDPLENLTIVCRLAGVDALLLMTTAEPLTTSVVESFIISSGALKGCLSDEYQYNQVI